MKKIRTARVDRYRPHGDGEHRSVAVLVGLIVLGVVLALGLVGFIVYQGMLRSDFFQLTAIGIEGCRRVPKSKVLELSGVDIYANLLSLSVDEMRERIEAHEWIAAAAIERHWPNRLEVTITERKPAALVNRPDGFHFVDGKGVIFAAALPPEDMDFPVISGIAEDVAEGSEGQLALREALSFVGYAGCGNPILPRQNISELYVDKDGGLVLLLADRPFPIYLGREQMKTKYGRLVRVLHWLYTHKKFETTAAIRMDYRPDKVLVVDKGAS